MLKLILHTSKTKNEDLSKQAGSGQGISLDFETTNTEGGGRK